MNTDQIKTHFRTLLERKPKVTEVSVPRAWLAELVKESPVASTETPSDTTEEEQESSESPSKRNRRRKPAETSTED